MKTPLSASILLAAAALSQTAWTQTHNASPANAPVLVTPEPAVIEEGGKDRSEQRIEKLHHADSGSTIDELRVGGESQTITVKPNNRAPAYQITPERTNPSAAAGQRMWNVLKF